MTHLVAPLKVHYRNLTLNVCTTGSVVYRQLVRIISFGHKLRTFELGNWKKNGNNLNLKRNSTQQDTASSRGYSRHILYQIKTLPSKLTKYIHMFAVLLFSPQHCGTEIRRLVIWCLFRKTS